MNEAKPNESPIERLKKHTEKRLLEMGFPLALRTHQILVNSGWTAYAESAWEDPDEHKVRRADFWAHRTLETEHKHIPNVEIDMLIECKRQLDNPWVFYTVEKELVDLDDADTPLDYPGIPYVVMEEEWLKRFKESDLKKLLCHSHQLPSAHATQAIAGVDIGSRDALYEAVVSVTKALVAHIEMADEAEETNVEESKSARFWTKLKTPDALSVYYPAVVFDGVLFEATLTGDEIALEETRYVQFEWETRDDMFIVDVVSSAFLEEYLAILAEELLSLKKGVESLK